MSAALAEARARVVEARIVGGAVRDAFLGRRSGDLDLAVSSAHAEAFAGGLAARLGTRAVALGRPGTRVFRIPAPPGEIDVWEVGGTVEEDRDRRDFTVNALSFVLPGWRFDAPEGALADLAAGVLRPPRPGVLHEDPLRVLRAARFCAELPGFRVHGGALAELRAAAPRLAGIAPERRLTEWDRILVAPRGAAARAAADLERWGALAALVPGSSAAERRAGIRRLRLLPRGSAPASGRVALLAPLGVRALEVLALWNAPRDEQRLAARVLALDLQLPATRAGVARAARALAPQVREAAAVLRTDPRAGVRRLGAALARLPDGRLERILRPPRHLTADEVAGHLGIAGGPALGDALRALDDAVATGRVRSAAGARRLLRTLGR